jgi:hypothetical protein
MESLNLYSDFSGATKPLLRRSKLCLRSRYLVRTEPGDPTEHSLHVMEGRGTHIFPNGERGIVVMVPRTKALPAAYQSRDAEPLSHTIPRGSGRTP